MPPATPGKTLRRHGANLPHWEKPGGTYAVTFRTADSLPASVLERWRHEAAEIRQNAQALGREPSVHEQARLDWLASEAAQEYLDAGHGACPMRDPRHAKIVADALRFFEGSRHETAAFCVMPNHVHIVFRPLPGFTLSELVKSWKSFSARAINRSLGTEGSLWQIEPYDHLIRDHQDFRHAVDYVRKNPVKAQLKDWPWVQVNDGFIWR